MTVANITSGFRSIGIYPYNPSAIPDEALAPSTISRGILELDTSSDEDIPLYYQNCVWELLDPVINSRIDIPYQLPSTDTIIHEEEETILPEKSSYLQTKHIRKF